MLSSHGWENPGYYYNANYNPSAGNGSGNSSPNYSSNSKSTPYYLNIPVHIGYKFSAGRNVSLFVNAGPYISIGLFGKATETIFPDEEQSQPGLRQTMSSATRCSIASIGDWDSVLG